jgi:hypothetical protein
MCWPHKESQQLNVVWKQRCTAAEERCVNKGKEEINAKECERNSDKVKVNNERQMEARRDERAKRKQKGNEKECRRKKKIR